jgi:nucleolar complex protein 3
MTSLVLRMPLILAVSTKGPRSPNTPLPDAPSVLCTEAIVALFKQDEVGENALEAVKLISKLIKTKNFHVHPRVLDTFLALSLVIEPTRDDGQAPNKKPFKKDPNHIPKRQKKKFKMQQEVHEELKEAEATISQEDKQKLVRLYAND